MQVASNIISQDWEFIITGIWVIDGPFDKWFNYTVNFSVSDDFGNAYPELSSYDLSVDVRVAPRKQVAAGNAVGDIAFAAALAAAGALAAASIIGFLGPAEDCSPRQRQCGA